MREIERRIQRAEKSQGDEALLLPARPAGVPFDYEEHVELMYDLMALAYQANITRVVTFMVSREVSNRTYPQVGVTDGHHAISHHQNRRREDGEERPHPDLQRRRCSASSSSKLKNTPDGDGSLLDNTRAALRQQHEQQQRARSLPAAEPRGRRRAPAGCRAGGTCATRITRR